MNITPPIYLINLDRRPDRLAECNLLFNYLDWNYTKLRAIEPSTSAGFVNPQNYGCFLSHVFCMMDAIRRGHTKIIICEDDLNIRHCIKEDWKRIMALIGYDLLFLHGNTGKSEEFYVRRGPCKLTHFYVVANIPKVLHLLMKHSGICKAYDQMLIEIARVEELTTFVTTKPYTTQRNGMSDLAPGRNKEHKAYDDLILTQ